MNAVLGVVLCGGASRRMGTDKAELSLLGAARAVPGDQHFLAHAVSTLRPISSSVVLACGASARYTELDLPLTLDREARLGPLAGIEAALRAATERQAGWTLVMPVDLPDVTTEHLAELLDHARRTDAEVAVFHSARGPEPLVGAYRTHLLDRVRASLTRGERRPTDFWGRAGGQDPVRVVHLDAPDAVTRNLNTRADYEAWQGAGCEEELA